MNVLAARGAVGLVATAVLLFTVVPAHAGNDDLSGKVEALERAMEEMRVRHEAETAELREKIRALEGEGTEESGVDLELERLLALAEEEAGDEAGAREPEGSTNFVARGLGLQQLNPEISLAGDVIYKYTDPEDGPSDVDFFARVFDLHIESYLDPYTKLKAAVGLFPDGAALGEGYVTRYGIFPGVSLTAGKFRQQFGVVNRWHKHALDQLDFPMPLRRIFGEGGLNQTGISLEWAIPELLGASHTAILQITEGENGRVFGENSRHLPCALLRLSRFDDLSKDTWLEFGLTGLAGVNDRWEVGEAIEKNRLPAIAAGADLTIRWEPTERMRYANFEWRTELYYLRKSLLAPDGSGRDSVSALGIYTSLQRQISRTVEVGVRLDWYRPDQKDYADMGLAPLAYSGRNPRQFQVSPYITWWQSPFVKVRFEIDWLDGHHAEPSQLVFALQIVFAAGPHKHERY